LRELDERRAAILESISQQGKLDAALKHAINAANSKARLEDLYLPYRPKRRTPRAARCTLPSAGAMFAARSTNSPSRPLQKLGPPVRDLVGMNVIVLGPGPVPRPS
jgi:hypothetical protein